MTPAAFEFYQKIMSRPDAFQQIQAATEALRTEKEERLKFYEWITEDIKAEFIHGQIVIQSPVKLRHWRASDLLSSLLSFFVRVKKLGQIGTEKVMIALTRNDYEPDLVFFENEKASQFLEDQVLFPAPDFVVEILSKSTAHVDRNIKKADYAMHGVREYWIIDPVKQRIEQYILASGATEYFPAKVHMQSGVITSDVITGFEIPVAAIFDEKINLETMQRLIS